MLQNALFALYLQRRLIDFNQTCRYIIGRCKRTDQILVTLTIFQDHRRSKNVGKCLVCTLSSEGMKERSD